ncbi:MAG: TfoX/Sxy family protein [Pseudomonadota bacterium]
MNSADIEDLFAPIGEVKIKRMFGGRGVYLDGLIFAIEAYGELYMKTDGDTRDLFRDAQSVPFVFESKRGKVATSYWRLPASAFDDEDALRHFTGLAVACAQRADEAKKRKPKRGRKGD